VLVAEQRACALPLSSTGDRWTATFDALAAEGACREAPEADAVELHALGERLLRASDRPGRGDLVRDSEGGWLPWRLPRGIDPAPVEPLRVEGPARVFATAEAGLGVLDQALRHAEERVTVTSYLLTSQPVVDRLARTAEAGVDVQLWLEPDPVGGKPAVTEDLVAELEARGVRVHEATGPTDGGLQHAKIVVVDSSLVIVLTENLTEHGLPRGGEANMGLGVAIANATLAARVEQVFREPGEPRAIEPDGWRSIDAPVTVLTSPENAWRDEGVPAWLARTEGPVEGAVLRANPRWGPEANPWLEALARHSQNASVDVLLSGNQEGAARSNREALAHLEAHPDAGALDARLSDPRRGTLHAKTIVTDGALLVGSSNWGLGGALFNREINLLVEDAHLAAEARAIVDGWDEAPAIGSPLPRAVDAIGPAAAIVLAAAAGLAARLSWPGSAPWRRRRS
jgi:phosphatidylserine/phosphatidylglycerophosphate/cardiolipin synthase-like enzyme